MTQWVFHGSIYHKYMEEHKGEKSDDELEDDCMEYWKSQIKEMAYHLREGNEPTQTNEYEEMVTWETTDNHDGTYTYGLKEDTEEQKEINKKWSARIKEIEEYRQQELKKGLEMFVEYFEGLWW